MNCPSCSKAAIKFIDWCQGRNAFSTECISCGVPLKAKMSVYLGFICTLLFILAALPFLDDIWAFLEIEQNSKLMKIAILFPIALPPAFVTWKKGGYKVKSGI